MCICGATNILADDLVPNKTLRDTIINMVVSKSSSKSTTTENSQSQLQIQGMQHSLVSLAIFLFSVALCNSSISFQMWNQLVVLSTKLLLPLSLQLRNLNWSKTLLRILQVQRKAIRLRQIVIVQESLGRKLRKLLICLNRRHNWWVELNLSHNRVQQLPE